MCSGCRSWGRGTVGEIYVALLLYYLSSYQVGGARHVRVSRSSVSAMEVSRKIKGGAIDSDLGVKVTSSNSCLRERLLTVRRRLEGELGGAPCARVREGIAKCKIKLRYVSLSLVIGAPRQRGRFQRGVVSSPIFYFRNMRIPIVGREMDEGRVHNVRVHPRCPIFSAGTLRTAFVLDGRDNKSLAYNRRCCLAFRSRGNA